MELEVVKLNVVEVDIVGGEFVQLVMAYSLLRTKRQAC